MKFKTDNSIEIESKTDEQNNIFFDVGVFGEGHWLCLYLSDIIKALNNIGYEVYESNSANEQIVNQQKLGGNNE